MVNIVIMIIKIEYRKIGHDRYRHTHNCSTVMGLAKANGIREQIFQTSEFLTYCWIAGLFLFQAMFLRIVC